MQAATEPPATVSVFVPGLRVQSEMNVHEHWRSVYGRKCAQGAAVAAEMILYVTTDQRKALEGLPNLRVTMTRVYASRGRAMDTDNLASAFKFVRDAVAAWLGRDDSPTSGIEWVTAQERGEEYGVKIEIRETQP